MCNNILDNFVISRSLRGHIIEPSFLKSNHIWITSFIITHIHDWLLQLWSLDYDVLSHTIYVVCVNFILRRWNLQFKVNSERQIFSRNFSWQFYFNTQSFCQKPLEIKSPKKYLFHIFVLISNLGYELWPHI